MLLNNKNVIRVRPGDCSDFNQQSEFIVKFDTLKSPDPTLPNGIINFFLIDNKKKQTIINSQIYFGLDVLNNYQQFLFNVPENWKSSINPRPYSNILPTGTVSLQSPENNLFFFDFFIDKSIVPTTEVSFGSIGYYVNISNTIGTSPDNNCQTLINKNNDLTLVIKAQSDDYGLNLTEISAIVTGKKKYPNGYCQESRVNWLL
jgi:hypothetical protein